jgi:hypothetical protein
LVESVLDLGLELRQFLMEPLPFEADPLQRGFAFALSPGCGFGYVVGCLQVREEAPLEAFQCPAGLLLPRYGGLPYIRTSEAVGAAGICSSLPYSIASRQPA